MTDTILTYEKNLMLLYIDNQRTNAISEMSTKIQLKRTLTLSLIL